MTLFDVSGYTGPWIEDEPLAPVGLDEHLTLANVLDTQATVWSETLGHSDPPVGSEGRAYWRASNLGYCERRQVLWRGGVAPTRIESDDEQRDKVRRFSWGNDLHAHLVERVELSGLLIAAEAPLFDKALALSGTMDLVWGGRVWPDLPARAQFWTPEYVWAVRELRARLMEQIGDRPIPVTVTEIKTTSKWAVEKLHRDGPRIDHRMQLAAYALLARRNVEQLSLPEAPERYIITVVGRDAVQPFEFGLPPHDVEDALAKVERLNAAWRSGNWPVCTCGTTPSIEWEQRYCPFADPDDPAACCGFGLLERLEASIAERLNR